MNRKIILIIGVIIVVLVLGYFFLWMKSGFIDYRPQTNEVASTQNYYGKLTNECKTKESESCCLASVEAMKAGNYTLAPQEGCPAGYQPNMMRCVDSYRWCQPMSVSPTGSPAEIETNYPVSGIEDGGYSGTAFCNLIGHSDFELKNNLMTIHGKGPYAVMIYKMRNIFSPNEYPGIKLISHLRFEDKENSYADTLYLGSDNNLYNCHGGK